MRKIELLAPARDAATARAAIDCGADAVYIGAKAFGARAAAGNSVDDIAAVCAYARPFGVKVYATFNTLLMEEELSAAERSAREVVAAGVDALIVQDMAYLRMGLGISLHASTQTTNTTPERVRFLAACGFSRVVLERGLTLNQIAEIRAAMPGTEAAPGVELECFVHGAICVGHSGDCYLSRSMGPRSGNRGECSQPCRLTYDLEDEQGRKLFEGKHLLSLRDLDLTAAMPDLLDAGITSLKIEGRLKDTTYVINTVTHYRREIDRIIAARTGTGRRSGGASRAVAPKAEHGSGAPPTARQGLERSSYGVSTGYPEQFAADPSRSFSRGSTEYYLRGKVAGAASFDTPKSIGAPAGRIAEVGRDYFTVRDGASLMAGDGICLFSEGKLLGTNINRIEGGHIYPNRMEGLAPGVEISRNFDKRFNDALLSADLRRQLPVAMRLNINDNVILTVRDLARGVETSATLPGPFPRAENSDRMAETIRRQLSKSGGTIFSVEEVEIATEKAGGGAASEAGSGVAFERSGPAALPLLKSAQINALRREALERLADKLTNYHVISPQPNEDKTFPYPTSLGPVTSATNSLARAFYADHGAKLPPIPKELMPDLTGQCVMTTPYCLRRETGQCLLDNPLYRGALYLTRGRLRYRLRFDCEKCLMNIEPI